MDIRIAASADRDAVVALWKACDLTRPWNDPVADFDRAIGGHSSTILVGHVGSRLAATAMVGDDGHRGWMNDVAVRPDLRGRGHGVAIMSCGGSARSCCSTPARPGSSATCMPIAGDAVRSDAASRAHPEPPRRERRTIRRCCIRPPPRPPPCSSDAPSSPGRCSSWPRSRCAADDRAPPPRRAAAAPPRPGRRPGPPDLVPPEPARRADALARPRRPAVDGPLARGPAAGRRRGEPGGHDRPGRHRSRAWTSSGG